MVAFPTMGAVYREGLNSLINGIWSDADESSGEDLNERSRMYPHPCTAALPLPVPAS